MKIPHPIPYQGSKRWLAHTICQCLPRNVPTFYEPFAGSAAVTLAAAAGGLAGRFALSDIHPPLMSLWNAIVNAPEELAAEYECLWTAQTGRGRDYYDEVRSQFNRGKEPAPFLYLLARCVKAAIRYNTKGEFNNSPDNRRLGAKPRTMRWHIHESSRLLRVVTDISCRDFRDATAPATADDVIFMDPPYQGVSRERDARYVSGLGYADFCDALAEMNRRGLSYIVSYDGRTGERRYGEPLPKELELLHFEVAAGRSTQETLLGRDSTTYESVYLSQALIARIGRAPASLSNPRIPDEQLSLFEGAA